jgi:hypothetical protein
MQHSLLDDQALCAQKENRDSNCQEKRAPHPPDSHGTPTATGLLTIPSVLFIGFWKSLVTEAVLNAGEFAYRRTHSTPGQLAVGLGKSGTPRSSSKLGMLARNGWSGMLVWASR